MILKKSYASFLLRERERVLVNEGNKFLEPTIFSSLKIIPEKITITAPKESNN